MAMRRMIPARATIKTMIPKSGSINDIFSPLASSEGVSSPCASTASNALINPKVRPIKPHATANHPMCFIKEKAFSLIPFLTKAKMISPITARRQIKMTTVNTGPPSINFPIIEFIIL